MFAHADTRAFAVEAPYLLARGMAQTIQAPMRDPGTGALVAPDASGCTVTIVRPNGSTLVSGAAAPVSSSIAGYTLTPAASETLGEGWEVRWSLVFDGVAFPTIRQSAYLCEYVPPNVVSPMDLYTRVPELRARIPQAQGERGDNTGWQPQIDEAYYQLLQKLVDDARKPWLIREVTGYREWLVVRALQLCVGAISAGPDTRWAKTSKDLYHEMRDAKAGLRIQYATDEATFRRGGSPVIRLAPLRRAR